MMVKINVFTETFTGDIVFCGELQKKSTHHIKVERLWINR
jgi:hypothetical protein